MLLFDRLSDHFGKDRLFMDVENLAPGVDFVTTLEKAIAECGVMIALIGPDWLDAHCRGGQ